MFLLRHQRQEFVQYPTTSYFCLYICFFNTTFYTTRCHLLYTNDIVCKSFHEIRTSLNLKCHYRTYCSHLLLSLKSSNVDWINIRFLQPGLNHHGYSFVCYYLCTSFRCTKRYIEKYSPLPTSQFFVLTRDQEGPILILPLYPNSHPSLSPD